MAQRIAYIDRLKGFAILSVVVGHLTIHPLEMETDVVRNLVGCFHVPLLFFLSGIVIATPPRWLKLVRKTLSFIMPFLTIGLSYSYVVGDSVVAFFTQSFKLGYWYLLVLAEFYILLKFFSLNRIKSERANLLCDIGIALFIWSLIFILNHTLSWGTVVSTQQCFDYWPIFISGFIIRRHSLIETIFNCNILYTLALIGFILFYYLYASGSASFLRIVFPFSVFFIFYLFRQRMNKSSFIERQLEWIGQRSLDVYIYQYFIIWTGLLSMKHLGAWFFETNNILIEALLTTVMAFAVGYLCIFIGFAIKQSRILRGVIYGAFFDKQPK